MAITKRSVVLDGHKTSVSLEDEFWDGLRMIAAQQNLKRSILVAKIAKGRTGKNLSSAIRLFVLDHFRAVPELEPLRQTLKTCSDNQTGQATPAR